MGVFSNSFITSHNLYYVKLYIEEITTVRLVIRVRLHLTTYNIPSTRFPEVPTDHTQAAVFLVGTAYKKVKCMIL